MEFIFEYGLFLAKAITILVAILVVISALVGLGQKTRRTDKGYIEVRNMNDNMDNITNTLKSAVLNKSALKQDKKDSKKKRKEEEKTAKQELKQGGQSRSRVYVIDFEGDLRASAVSRLREEVTAILSVAGSNDEVVVKLESPGGLVHSYGLAASQLRRIVDRQVPLTVAVDKVAASGGYMMACIANNIIAAPFALLGSIGVVAQMPNFHKLLKNKDVDFDVYTAGEHKRTLTVFGENTEEGRKKFMEELEDLHDLFKEFVGENRPQVNISEVATGEAWYGTRALKHALVDELKTSDEYLYDKCQEADVFQVKFVEYRSKLEKMMEKMAHVYTTLTGPSQFPRL
ncbi:MAG: protease SohB [Pseudomonadales bacterium]